MTPAQSKLQSLIRRNSEAITMLTKYMREILKYRKAITATLGVAVPIGGMEQSLIQLREHTRQALEKHVRNQHSLKRLLASSIEDNNGSNQRRKYARQQRKLNLTALPYQGEVRGVSQSEYPNMQTLPQGHSGFRKGELQTLCASSGTGRSRLETLSTTFESPYAGTSSSDSGDSDGGTCD